MQNSCSTNTHHGEHGEQSSCTPVPRHAIKIRTHTGCLIYLERLDVRATMKVMNKGKAFLHRLILAGILSFAVAITFFIVATAGAPSSATFPFAIIFILAMTGHQVVDFVATHFHIKWTPPPTLIRLVSWICFYFLASGLFWCAEKIRKTGKKVLIIGSASLAGISVIAWIAFIVLTVSRPAKEVTIFDPPKSQYVGNKIRLPLPFVYLANLPKGGRRNSYSVYVADYALDQFRNHCSNCIDSKRLETPIRVVYLPQGTELTVVDSFRVERTGLGYGIREPLTFLVLKDNQGRTSECLESSSHNFLNPRPNHLFGNEQRILSMLKDFEKSNTASVRYCTKSDAEPRFDSFLKDFKLGDQISYRREIVHPGPYSQCYRLEFHSTEALMTAYYFFDDWRLYGRWENSG